MQAPETLGIIAGSGAYPILLARSARAAGVRRILAVAVTEETDPQLADVVDEIEWLRVGQLARLLQVFRRANVQHAIMAGQIAPKNLFDLRPDWKALLLLARLERRNAETIFGAIADELSRIGVELLAATTFLEKHVASEEHIAGKPLSRREEADVNFGFTVAREISRLDIGQTIVVKNGTVLAVEAFEGTDEAIRRGGALGRKASVMIKVSKPNQDLRFDVPVIGVQTVHIAAEARLRVIAVEAGRTLLLERESLCTIAERSGISIVAR